MIEKLIRSLVAVLVMVGISEVSPTFANGLLILLISGVILSNHPRFVFLADWLGKIAGDEEEK